MKTLHPRKKQKPEHVLVRIKNELGLRQDEISESLGIPLDTFKNIVYARVKAWNEHASTVSRSTGVSVQSLLANNPRKRLLTNDGKRWTAEEYAPGIAWRSVGDLKLECSRGRHTLQWFRIVMIKVCRCMLAAYCDKKSGEAFVKLRRAIREVGKSFPSYTAEVPYKHRPGEPLRSEVSPRRVTATLTKICLSQAWDGDLQSAVAAIPSTSVEGVTKIFDAFLKEVLAEEAKQLGKLQFNLREAEKKAKAFAATNAKAKPAKPPYR